MTNRIGVGEHPSDALRLVIGGFGLSAELDRTSTAAVLEAGPEVARFSQRDILASRGTVDLGHRRAAPYQRHQLYSRESGDVETVIYREPERLVAQVPRAELDRPSLGRLAPYLHRIREVIAGYDCGPRLEFLRYLPEVVGFRSVSTELKDISGLRHLSGLRELQLDCVVFRLEVLAALEALEMLYLDDWRPGAEGLFELQRLVRVHLQRYGDEDLSPMTHWTGLRALRLNAGRLRELGGVPRGVRILWLTDQRKLGSLRGLVGCPGLRWVLLRGCRETTSLAGLEQCRELESLSLRRVGPVPDLEPLQGLSRLRRLDLAEGTVTEETNLEALYSLPSLDQLCLSRKARLDTQRLLAARPGCHVFRSSS